MTFWEVVGAVLVANLIYSFSYYTFFGFINAVFS